jgi:hypothetical protein
LGHVWHIAIEAKIAIKMATQCWQILVMYETIR